MDIDPEPDFVYGPTVTQILDPQAAKFQAKQPEHHRQSPRSSSRINFLSRSHKKKKENIVHLEDGISNYHVKVPAIIGFSSASGKPVKISSTALDEAKKLFQDLDEEDNSNDISTHGLNIRKDFKSELTSRSSTESLAKPMRQSEETSSHNSNIGFSSAAGRKITISKNAFAQAKKLLEPDEQINGLLDQNASAIKNIISISDKASITKVFDQNGELLLPTKAKEGSVSNLEFSSVSENEHPLSRTHSEKLLEFDISLAIPTSPNGDAALNMGFSSVAKKMVKASRETIAQIKHTSEADDKCISPKDLKLPPFAGFSSAAGKKISISTEALVCAKKIFEMEDIFVESPTPQKSFEILAAAKENIEMSTNTLIPSQKLTNNDNLTLPNIPDEGPVNGLGFFSASGSEVSKSDQTVTQAKTQLETVFSLAEPSSSKSKSTVFAFSSPVGKEIEKVNEAHLQVKKLFDEDNFVKPLPPTKTSTASLGFSSAAGKKIEISSESLAQAKKLFENEEFLFPKKLSECPVTSFVVSSAAGTKIEESNEESNEAIAQSTKHFDTETIFVNPLSPTKDSSKTFGFLSAAGKKIKISNEALEQAKMLFDKEDILPPSTKTPLSCGFSSASGKKIELSKKSLVEAKKLFDEEAKKLFDEEDQFLQSPLPSKASIASLGFSSAAGKKIEISKEALVQAKKLFDEDKLDKPPAPAKTSTASFGFSSAAGKKIEISKEALWQAKKLFDEEDKFIKPASPTAGKKMNSSSGALNQAKKLFQTNEVSHISVTKTSVTDTSEKLTGVTKRRMLETLKNGSATKRQKSFDNFDTEEVYKNIVQNMDSEVVTEMECLPDSEVFSQNVEGDVLSPILTNPYSIEDMLDCVPILTGPHGSIEQKFQTGQEIINQVDGFKVPYKGPIGDKVGESSTKKDTINFFPARRTDTVDQNSKIEKNGCDLNVSEQRRRARESQLKKIEEKIARKKCSKTSSGCLLAQKKIGTLQKQRIQLKRLGSPTPYVTDLEMHRHGVRPSVRNILNSNDAKNFVFRGSEFFGSDILDSVGILPVGLDGAEAILSDDNSLGPVELFTSFRLNLTEEPQRVSNKWFENHFRWLVWKLAKMEQKFPKIFGGSALTPAEVMQQIKLRYDRELENGERSCLKKIYEGDESSNKCLVLVVANIWKIPAEKRSTTRFVVELSDGWYSIGWKIAQNDDPFRKWIESGVIVEGTKIITFGAEIQNLEKPCGPLDLPSVVQEIDRILSEENEMSESSKDESESPKKGCKTEEDFKCVFLKLHANSTRRARWDSKLGFQHRIATMPTAFLSLLPNGGFVSEIYVEIVRKYPLLFAKFDQNGATTFISERAEEKRSKIQSCLEQKAIEDIYMQVQKEFERKFQFGDSNKKARKTTRNKLRLSDKEIRELTCGEEINDAIESAVDPSSVESILSSTQIDSWRDFKRNQAEELQSEIKAEVQQRVALKLGLTNSKENQGNSSKSLTKTTPLIRLRIVDLFESNKNDKDEETSPILSEIEKTFSGMLTLWRPDKDLVEHLSENSRFRIFGLVANSIRDGDIQFRTSKQTKFVKDEKAIAANKKCEKDVSEFERTFTDIGDIIFSDDFCPKFNEVDLVGIVINVVEKSSHNSSRPNFETVHICDTMFNYAAIHFWGGLSECGFDKSMFLLEVSENNSKKTPNSRIVETKSNVLIFKNLQWRPSSSKGGFYNQSSKEIPCLYVTEQTVITGCPRAKREAELIREMKSEVQKEFDTFLSKAVTELKQLANSSTKKFSPHIPSGGTTPQSSIASAKRHNTPKTRDDSYPLISNNFLGRMTHDEEDDPFESRLVRGPVEAEEGSPAFSQSLRNKKKLEKLKQVQWHIPFSPRSDSNPHPVALGAEPDQEEGDEEMDKEPEKKTPISVTRKKLMTPFRIPFK